jgi:hypothetical protein
MQPTPIATNPTQGIGNGATTTTTETTPRQGVATKRRPIASDAWLGEADTVG